MKRKASTPAVAPSRSKSEQGKQTNKKAKKNGKNMAAAAVKKDKRLPVTLLSGFLGSGKTTLLKRILTANHNMKIAVVVNDMAALNIDGQIVGRVIQREAKLVQMQNGCICCTLREDLLEEVARLAAEKSFDYLIIESTGISEPMQVAETFTFELPDLTKIKDEKSEKEGRGPKDENRVDTPPTPDQDVHVNDVNGVYGIDHEVAIGAANGIDGVSKKSKAKSKSKGKNKASTEVVAEGHKSTDTTETSADQGDAKQPTKPTQHEDAKAHHHIHKHDDNQVCLRTLSSVARLDTCVTVMDVSCFWDNLHSIEELKDRHPDEVDKHDERNVASLLIDQIEFADVILLNKTDLLGKKQMKRIHDVVKTLNPSAKVFNTVQSEIDLTEVVNTNLFSLEKAAKAAGWLQAINAPGEAPKSESEEYGITSFVYRARKPFHPGRLYKKFLSKYFLTRVVAMADPEEEEGEEDQEGETADDSGSGDEENNSSSGEEEEETEEEDEGEEGEARKDALSNYAEAAEKARQATKRDLGNLLRSKGYFWLATQPDTSMGWSHAGAVLTVASSGTWFAGVPEEAWPEDEEIRSKIREDFDPNDPEVGDRRQELVFIGQDLKEDVIRAALDACLATKAECRQAALGKLPDPLLGDDSDSEEEEEEEEDEDDKQLMA